MDRDSIDEVAWGSVTGSLRFPEVVERLRAAGVQQYVADLVRREVSYLGAGKAAHRAPLCVASLAPPAEGFDAVAMRGAVVASQRGEVDYPGFLARAVAAGCFAYHVFLEGRQVHYLGRRGESHVERLPGSS